MPPAESNSHVVESQKFRNSISCYDDYVVLNRLGDANETIIYQWLGKIN